MTLLWVFLAMSTGHMHTGTLYSLCPGLRTGVHELSVIDHVSRIQLLSLLDCGPAQRAIRASSQLSTAVFFSPKWLPACPGRWLRVRLGQRLQSTSCRRHTQNTKYGGLSGWLIKRLVPIFLTQYMKLCALNNTMGIKPPHALNDVAGA